MIDESFSLYDDANSRKNDNEDSISDLNKSIKLKNLSVRTNHTEYNIINLRNFFEKITEKNLLWMKDKELNKEEYKKHFIEDKIIDCQINENETLPIPIYLNIKFYMIIILNLKKTIQVILFKHYKISEMNMIEHFKK